MTGQVAVAGVDQKLQVVLLEVPTVYLVATSVDPVTDPILTFQGIDP